MADALMVSPFIGSGFALPGFTDDRDSTTAENLTHRFWSRASSLKKPLDGTSKRESSTVGRFSSFKSHQPSQEIATTVEAEDAKGARRASKHNRIFKAIVKKWLTMRKNTTETPGILKRNDPDDVAPQPPPMIPYGILIAEALQYSGEPSLSAKKICKHIMESYKWYKDNQHVGWQGEIFKELSENPGFETVSVRQRGRSCHSIKWRLTSARKQELDQAFLSRREPISASSRVAEWAQAIQLPPSDTASTVVESVTTATVVGSTASSLPIIYEVDNNPAKKKKRYSELDGDNIIELPGDSAIPRAPSPPRTSPAPKKLPLLAPSLDSNSFSISTTLHSPVVFPRSASLRPGDSVSVVSTPVTPSPTQVSRKLSARPVRSSLPACLTAVHPRSAVISPLSEAISSSSCASSPFTYVVYPPDDVASPSSDAVLPPDEVISLPGEAISPPDEVVSPPNDVASLLGSAISSHNDTASPSRSTISLSRGMLEASETNSNPSSPTKAPKASLKRVTSNLLRHRKISRLAKASTRKFKTHRVFPFSKGDGLASHVRRSPVSLKPSPDIPQDHIDVVSKATAQPDMQPPESDSSSTEPKDGEGSSSSGGASSSRTSLDSTRDSQRSENSTGDDSSKRSASRESGGSGGGKGSGDQGGSDDEQNRRRKKPRKFRETPVKKKFACPYYKYDPQVYGIHGYERFRTCQCTGYDFISELRRHLKRVHDEYVCKDCYQTFKDEESCNNCQHLLGIRQGCPPEVVWAELWKQRWPHAPLPGNQSWERGYQINTASYAQGSVDSLPTDNVEISNFGVTSSESSLFRSVSVYSSFTVSPVEQETIKDQLTLRVGLLEQMITPFKDKLQLLDQIPAVSERSDTLADRISGVEAKMLDLNWTMINLLSHLLMGASIVDHSRPPAGSGVSATHQNSMEGVPLTADPLNAGGQGNTFEASYKYAAFANAISTGVNMMDENNLKWSDNSNNSPFSMFQPDIGFPKATNTGQGSSESQVEPGLPLEPIGWAAQNNNPISGNLDDFFHS